MRNDCMEKSIDGNIVYIHENPKDLSFRLAQNVIGLLNKYIEANGQVVFQVSSGGSPKILYELLTTHFKNDVNWEKVILVQMDEYIGIDLDHPASQYAFLHEALISKLNFGELIIFDEQYINNPEAYDEKLVSLGGIDISLQGIGENGHLAFNEPGSEFYSPTRKVQLHEDTRIANSRFFENLTDVPSKGITCGLAGIMSSKHIFLIGIGSKKAKALEKSILGPVSADVPASLLKTRNNVNYYIDIESAFCIEGKL